MPKLCQFTIVNQVPEEYKIELTPLLNDYQTFKIIRYAIDHSKSIIRLSIVVEDQQNESIIKTFIDDMKKQGMICECHNEHLEDIEDDTDSDKPDQNDEIYHDDTDSDSDDSDHNDEIYHNVHPHHLTTEPSRKKFKKIRHHHRSKQHAHKHHHHHQAEQGHEDHHHHQTEQGDGDHHHQAEQGHEDHHHHQAEQGHDHHHEHHHSVRKGILGVFFGGGLLALPFVLSLLSLNLPMIALYVITGVSTLVTFYLGKDTYISGIKSVYQDKQVNMETLYTISTLILIAVSIASFFVPGLPMITEAAPLILGFWHIGEAIEETLNERANINLNIHNKVPQYVQSLNRAKLVSIHSLIPNEIITLKKGSVIPIDGECEDEEASVLTNKVDGSPYPQSIKKGTRLLAGMQVDSDNMTIRVKKTYQHSFLANTAEKIRLANIEETPIVSLTHKILQYFIPGLVSVSIIAGIVVGIVLNPALAIQCAISILVSACPCALSLVTPTAIKIGMTKAANNNVIFKNGKALQAAGNIDTVVFDLNGTLTKGEPKLKEYKKLMNGIPDELIFQYTKALEQHSDHIFAKKLSQYASKKSNTECKLTVTDLDITNRSGVKAKINNDEFIIGNEMMLKNNQINLTTEKKNTEAHLIYLVKNQQIIAQFSFQDTLRKDAKPLVDKLKSMGKDVHICTGSSKKTADYFAEQLGIPLENVEGDCLDKSIYVEKLKAQNHKVAWVGDGLNDAVAVAKSDFSIAIQSPTGDETTEELAGAVIQKKSIMPVATAFEIGKLTINNIHQNLMISLFYNSTITLTSALLFITIGSALNPAIGIGVGILLMIMETCIILSNAYFFKQKQLTTAADTQHYFENDEKPSLSNSYSRFQQCGILSEKSHSHEIEKVNVHETHLSTDIIHDHSSEAEMTILSNNIRMR